MTIKEMTEPTVEEIVAQMERAHAGCPDALHWYTLADDLRALIADWRKRGEALVKAQEAERLHDSVLEGANRLQIENVDLQAELERARSLLREAERQLRGRFTFSLRARIADELGDKP